jgi:hypothetical protein
MALNTYRRLILNLNQILFHSEFNVVAGDDETLVRIQGQVQFDNGAVTVSVANIGTKAEYSLVETTIKCRIQGVGNGKGVVKSRPKNEGIDISCDIEDSFEVENIEEIIQDWKSLYNLDIIDQLKSYVKDQMKLNKDYEIADLLESNYLAGNGVCRTINMTTLQPAKLQPEKVMDMFKSIIPVIISLIEELRLTTRLEPKYLVTGIDTAAIIKSLQKFSVSFDKLEGQTGL